MLSWEIVSRLKKRMSPGESDSQSTIYRGGTHLKKADCECRGQRGKVDERTRNRNEWMLPKTSIPAGNKLSKVKFILHSLCENNLTRLKEGGTEPVEGRGLSYSHGTQL